MVCSYAMKCIVYQSPEKYEGKGILADDFQKICKNLKGFPSFCPMCYLYDMISNSKVEPCTLGGNSSDSQDVLDQRVGTVDRKVK